MGFCLPRSYLNSITLTLESQDAGWRRDPNVSIYQAPLWCSSKTFHLVLSRNFQGLTSHSLRRESVEVFVYLDITNCSSLFKPSLLRFFEIITLLTKGAPRTDCFFSSHSSISHIWRLYNCHWASWSWRRKRCKDKILEISLASPFSDSSHHSYRLPS